MLWKKNKKSKLQESKIILGMVMLQETSSLNLKSIIADFNSYYGNNIQASEGEDSTFFFELEGETIAIAHMPIPIPFSDIEETTKYAYNWQTAIEDTKGHKSHLIVSIMKGGKDQVKRYKIFTQILSTLLRTTNAIGIYQGTQSLLIPKNDYLNESQFLSEDYLPINLWIYIGLIATNTGNSGYTYGLKEFNKQEMEVVDSSKKLEEIGDFLSNITRYVLEHDVMFQPGQTVGNSEEEKIEIIFSKGKFLEGDTIKLAY